MNKRNYGCIAVIAIGFVIAFVTLTAALVYLQGRRQIIDDRREAIRERGEPVSREELNIWYEQPVGENAAPVFLRAAAELEAAFDEGSALYKERELPDGTPLFPAPGDELSAEAHSAIRELLTANEDTRQRIARGVALGGTRFPVDLAGGSAVHLTHLARIQVVARFMLADAVARILLDDPDSAVDSLVVALGTLHAINSFPALMGQLGRVRILSECTESFVDIVNRVQLAPDHLTAIASAFREAYSSKSLHTALIGERAITLSVGGTFNAKIFFHARDWPHLLDVYDALLESAEGTPRDVYLTVQKLNAPDGAATESGFHHPYAKTIVPTLISATEIHVRATARQELAILICQIERHRALNGQLPEDLNAANIQPANDPYTDTPLTYTRNETGYTVSAAAHENIALQVTH